MSTRTIRSRIKSISSTKKITKAMELVSASKMRRAVNSVLSTRPYSNLGWETVSELGKVTEAELHPLLRQPEKMERALVVLVSSDRGLCGGFNAQMAKHVIKFVQSGVRWRSNSVEVVASISRSQKDAMTTPKDAIQLDFVTVGKKGTDLARRLGWNIVATFNNLSNNPSILDVRPIAQLTITDFTSGKYDAAYVAYTDFISSIRQIPNIRQLLPITRDDMLGEVGGMHTPSNSPSERGRNDSISSPAGGEVRRGGSAAYSYDYLFEPTPSEVLDGMLPRLVEVQVYQAILESSASEHSARMVAMKSASDAARDMIDDLTFTFNQARQATITREIAEISAGKAALE